MKDTTFLQLIVLVIFLYPLSGQAMEKVRKARFQSSGRSVTYEVFDGGTQEPLVIILHGASGPDASLYRSQANYFSQNGHTVLLLHYFDASSSSTPSEENYRKWAQAVVDLIQDCATQPGLAGRKIALVGYSLGASVALAVGSSGASVDSIAEWYGSLPDEFFYKLQGMPRLLILHGARDENIPIINAQQLIKLCEIKRFECESHIYSDQAHGFAGQALEDADQRTLKFISEIKPSIHN